jgi:hypothetical protein
MAPIGGQAGGVDRHEIWKACRARLSAAVDQVHAKRDRKEDELSRGPPAPGYYLCVAKGCGQKNLILPRLSPADLLSARFYHRLWFKDVPRRRRA